MMINVVCSRVGEIDAESVAPGSVHRVCNSCGHVVWCSPAALQVLQSHGDNAQIICLICLAQQGGMFEDAEVMITKEQMDEIIEKVVTGKQRRDN